MRGASPISRIQLKQLLQLPMPIRDKTILVCGHATGFRISELLSLKVSDVCTPNAYGVNVIHSHVHVKAAASKTKVGRTVLLNTDAKKALTKLVEWLSAKGLDATAPLFVSRKHTNGFAAITRQQAGRLIKGLFALVGAIGANFSTHSMRKFFSKTIYDATGGKIELVQIALGHKSISSTISYLLFNSTEIDDAINAMEF